MAGPQPYIPRETPIVSTGGSVSNRWDASCFQPLVQAAIAFSSTILSGPDADPNGIVVGSPGYLYRALGEGVTASLLWVKESGVDTDTGWVSK